MEQATSRDPQKSSLQPDPSKYTIVQKSVHTFGRSGESTRRWREEDTDHALCGIGICRSIIYAFARAALAGQDASPSSSRYSEIVRIFLPNIFCLTNQTFYRTLPSMLDSQCRRLLDAYPAIFLACHRQHVREDEGGNPVTENQSSILDHLDAARTITLSKLAEHMGVGRSTMSIAVARLVRGGYISRKRDRSDKRQIALTLTPAGVRIKEENTVLDRELIKDMLRLMPPKELEIALHGIECLAKYAGILLRQRTRGRDR